MAFLCLIFVIIGLAAVWQLPKTDRIPSVLFYSFLLLLVGLALQGFPLQELRAKETRISSPVAIDSEQMMDLVEAVVRHREGM